MAGRMHAACQGGHSFATASPLARPSPRAGAPLSRVTVTTVDPGRTRRNNNMPLLPIALATIAAGAVLAGAAVAGTENAGPPPWRVSGGVAHENLEIFLIHGPTV